MLTIHHSEAGSASLTKRALLLVALVCVFVASTLAQNLPDVTASITGCLHSRQPMPALRQPS